MVLKQHKKIMNIYNIPIIYLTSYYDDEILEKASETKPYGYITKPYEDLRIKHSHTNGSLQTSAPVKNRNPLKNIEDHRYDHQTKG